MCQNHQHDISTAETPAPQTSAQAPEISTSSCRAGHGAAAPAVALGAPAQDELAECPVMPGSIVSKAEAEAAGLYRDYQGNRYWFCCAACGPMWDADPAKYAAV